MASYYVDATLGSDAAAGTSELTPWQTIDPKVNGESFSPSDKIYSKKGELWREQLTVPSSGLSGNPITFGAYGTGANPRITGSELITTWTEAVPANVWQATLTTEPTVVFFDDTQGTLESSAANCTAPGEWFWEANVLYVYSTSDPDTAFTSPGIEAAVRDWGIIGANKAYVALENIDVYCTNLANVYLVGNPGTHDGWTFADLTLRGGGGGGGGLQLTTSDGCSVTRVTSDGSDGPGLLINAMTNLTVVDCDSSNSNDNTYAGTGHGHNLLGACQGITIDGCTATGNNGFGFAFAGSTNAVIVRTCAAISSGDDGFTVFGTANDIDFYSCWATLNGTEMSAVEPAKGDGYTCHADNFDCNFYYCIAYYNYNSGWSVGLDSSGNIFNCISAFNGNPINDYTPGRGGYVINVDSLDSQSNTWAMKNCISYENNPKHLQLSAWSKDNCDLDYNVYFKIGEATSDNTFCNLDGGPLPDTSWDTYHASYEANSQYEDPLFVDPDNDDFTVQAGSPCIGAGIDVGLLRDYAGIPVGDPPTIGAFQFTNRHVGYGVKKSSKPKYGVAI